MAINNFKPFATGAGANVMAQSEWEGLTALLAGFSSGKASSAQVNKALRQATTIGALVGQFIANSGTDALDNGDINALVANFTAALTKNLSLGTASKKNTGTGAGQIPDMSSFITGGNGNDKHFSLPGGLIVQTKFVTLPANQATLTFTPNIAFPNRLAAGSAIHAGSAGYYATISATGSNLVTLNIQPNTYVSVASFYVTMIGY